MANMTEPKGTKDKACPFCHLLFTASSLGRHLDAFIRDKNPKQADDVHDIERIKALRAGITRRQPRQSRRRLSSSLEDASPCLAVNGGKSGQADGIFKTYFNKPGWEATGVITDLPAPSRAKLVGFPTSAIRASTSHVVEGPIEPTEVERDLMDQTRASELALQEVLESLKVAKRRAYAEPLFNFNFHALNLPQLYLRCLEPPRSLLSKPSQQHGTLTWSTEPPNEEQCEYLRAWLMDRISAWKTRQRDRHTGPSNGGSRHNLGHVETVGASEREIAGCYQHLDEQLKNWINLTAAERERRWHTECVRALSLEIEAHRETRRRLEQVEQELDILQTRIDRMALAKEHQGSLANTQVVPISCQTAAALESPDYLDHRELISKWKNRLRSSRSAQRPLGTEESLDVTGLQCQQLNRTHGDESEGETSESAIGEEDDECSEPHDFVGVLTSTQKGHALLDSPSITGKKVVDESMDLG